MYVAFTRAEEKLFIGVPYKGKDSYNAGKVIYQALANTPELSEKFDTQNYFYENGALIEQVRRADKDKEYKSYKTNGMVSENIFDKIIVKPEFENYVPENKTDLKQLKNRGIIIHKALSLINNSTNDEIEKAVSKLVILGLISEVQKVDLAEELKEILSNEKVSGWFDPKSVMNERDIILPGGSIYRPDKVILSEKKAVIIDYKSGIRKAEHQKQIRTYGEIIAKMGFTDVEMNLFYINELKIEEVKQN